MKTKDQRNCLYRPFAALMDVFGLFLPFTMPLTGVLIMMQSLTPMLTGAILGAEKVMSLRIQHIRKLETLMA
ncbi:hypothetical protein [Thalassospira sp. NFXS8]|uniref:hypothetical protein n=1 Tax=Thalassospira sp. NFXS8 TaxID=2819093 RepID=UPI0032DF88B9